MQTPNRVDCVHVHYTDLISPVLYHLYINSLKWIVVSCARLLKKESRETVKILALLECW